MNKNNTKILLAGEWCWYWYEEACANALEELGYKVIKYEWISKFKKFIINKVEPIYLSFSSRIQFRFLIGPKIILINQGLLKKSIIEKPDIIFLYNCKIIYPSTIKKIKKVLPNVIFAEYTQDNPFSEHEKRNIWRHFINTIPFIDYHFIVRSQNIFDFKKNGSINAFKLPQFFNPKYDFPICQSKIKQQFKCDVVFAGHYEDDGRVDFLEAICNEGYKLNLFGGGWDAAIKKLDFNSPLRQLFPISPVVGEDYQQAISGAKVALCFFSTLNKDAYTTRNFQIPAMKTTLLSQYSEELEDMFKEGEEIMFFRNGEELLNKLQILLTNDELRMKIAEAGYKKVYEGKHDVKSRMELMLSIINKK
jgi:spore maturation protein CgeB